MRRYDFALIGFGNVGRALAHHVGERRAALANDFGIDLALTAILDRGAMVAAPDRLPVAELARFKSQYGSLAAWPGVESALRPDELRARGIEGVVIALPTNLVDGEPGLSIARAALDCGLDVVLADKGPALHALPELEESATRANATLGTSATTGCALPRLSALRDWFAGAAIDSIRGVLNGTSNRILTQLREPGSDYAAALAQAQRDGIAEPDPTFDVEGFDTAVKLVILARGLLDPQATLERVERTGITHVPAALLAASRTGPQRLRLVGRATRTARGVELRVAPELVEPGDPLHAADGAEKAVTFHSGDLGPLTVLGGASHRLGTASALLRDLLAAARARR